MSLIDVYVASSWRNKYQQEVVRFLRARALGVYDFQNPRDGDKGFAWSEIDPAWQSWDGRKFRGALQHPLAVKGFQSDFEAMKKCAVCVLVLPSGRSAHLEAGWFVGARRPVIVLQLERCEPELMYSMCSGIAVTFDELEQMVFAALRSARPDCGCERCASKDRAKRMRPGRPSNPSSSSP